MIEFLTLFLGLAIGPQAVELSASAETAMVRLLLDGEVIASDEGPPWKVDVDLGTELRPHLLEAVSFDSNGDELGRATQWLNLPRPPAEVRVMLDRAGDGSARAARLTWESTIRRDPIAVRAWFDGEPLATSDPNLIPLPAHDSSQFHFLQVELEFSSDVIAEAQIAFGGAYLDQTTTDLTAVPVIAKGKARKAKLADMQRWFSAVDEPVRVVALDKGGLDLILVRGPGADEAVRSLPGTLDQPVYSGGLTTPGVGGVSDFSTVAGTGVATANDRLRRIMTLDEGQRLRLLLPRARSQAGHSVQMDVFALSPEITADQGGLYWALQQQFALPGLADALRLADAVAVAGLQAANGNRRRAVLLLLARDADDESRFGADQVRGYLSQLQVPLLVWRIGEEAANIESQWGDGETIASFQDLKRAARQLSEALEQQRIAWLEGRHLLSTLLVGAEANVSLVVQ